MILAIVGGFVSPSFADASLDCMTQNVYFEARSEEFLGQVAVAFVTMNRVHDDKYPDDVCKVVKQGKKTASGEMVRNKCQFSWYCDGKSDVMEDATAVNRAEDIALMVISLYDDLDDPTKGATMYHTTGIEPYWKTAFTETETIESHIFYR